MESYSGTHGMELDPQAALFKYPKLRITWDMRPAPTRGRI
jgi:hypothetical protein